MRRLVVQEFVTLDGVIQAPGAPDEDRDGGFARGGWLVPLLDEAFMERIVAWVADAGALMLGRGTYETFVQHWPLTEPDDPVGSVFNRIPKYVASRTLAGADWEGTTVIADVPDEVRALKEQDGGDIQVHGSAGLLQTLLREDLVDELRLMLTPVVVGPGKRLFGEGTAPGAFELVDLERLPTGIVLQTYRRDGALTMGSFGLEAE
ncbi:MAG: dihydrofolate reductase family protein [Thermoleophilia bacterium]